MVCIKFKLPLCKSPLTFFISDDPSVVQIIIIPVFATLIFVTSNVPVRMYMYTVCTTLM